jgi:hypothetical protein
MMKDSAEVQGERTAIFICEREKAVDQFDWIKIFRCSFFEPRETMNDDERQRRKKVR